MAGEHHHVFVAHLTDGRGLEKVEVKRVLAFVECLVLAAGLVEDASVGAAGRDEGVYELGAGPLGEHGVLVELAGSGVLESVEHVGTIALLVVGVFLVGNVLDEHRGVEVDKRAFDTACTVGRQVHGREGAVGAFTLAHHGDAPPAPAVRIEPVGLLASLAVNGLHEVGGIHRVPLPVDKPGEDGAFVAPLTEVFDGCRPHTDVVAAVLVVVYVVRANQVGTQLPRIVRVFKHAGFAIGNMFPQRQIGVLSQHRRGLAYKQ